MDVGVLGTFAIDNHWGLEVDSFEKAALLPALTAYDLRGLFALFLLLLLGFFACLTLEYQVLFRISD